MKIMTFNTQHCQNYVTRKIDYELMAKVIKDSGADIVGLNEMRGLGVREDYEEQVEMLAKLTGMPYFYFGKAIDFSGNPYGNGLLSKIPIVNIKTVSIPDPKPRKYEGYYETRGVIVAEIQGGVTVLVTHVGLNPDEAENAISVLAEQIKPNKCVLMGDFNMTPDNPLFAPILEKMIDTAEGLCADKLSYPSDNPDRKIDYIFISPDGKVLFSDIPTIIASDHRPHIAHVEFAK